MKIKTSKMYERFLKLMQKRKKVFTLYDLIQKLKGTQSFILSIEKCGYESCFSEAMMDKIHSFGFPTLKKLIDSL